MSPRTYVWGVFLRMPAEPTAGLTPPSPLPTSTPARKRRLPVWAWILIGVVALAVGVLLSPIFAVICLVILVTGIVALVRNTPTWLRFRNRKVATWVTAGSAVAFLLTGSLANAVIGGSGDNVSVAVAEPTPSSAATGSTKPTPTPTPTPTPMEAVTVIGVIDGDTIETSAGKVRIIGIDAPEEGAWGYSEAGAELGAFLSAGTVTLVAVEGRDDVDQYGRLLRYIRVDGKDAGEHMITTGWAIARYDSRDGYGGHPLETSYVTLDAAHEMPAEPAPEPAPAPAPAEPAPAPAQPVTDPQFGTCKEANANGYGNYQAGVDPEYNWYQDRDGDGWVCEM